MARIERVEVAHYRIPLPAVLSDSTHGTMTHFELVTASVRDAEGAEGLGYTYTVGHGGGAIARLIADDLAPVLEGAEADAIESLWRKMYWAVHFIGRGGPVSFAMAALDTALWDLKAKRSGLPLYRFLGGADPDVAVYAGGIDLQFTLDELLDQTRGFLERGFRAIKMKAGRDELSEDVERASAMRAFLGADFPLMIDANMRWRPDEAIRAARALQPMDLVWLEEPTVPEDVTGHARIAREGGIPIATGENFHNVAEFEAFIRADAVQFPEPDLATLGGITPFLKVAHLAEARNLPITTHGVHDLHVHLLAAIPNASFLEWHGFGLERFMTDGGLVIEEGRAVARNRPGHGVELDHQALAGHAA